MKTFKDKNVLVTGASSGIGAAIAEEFASRGACLFLTGRNQERLSAVAARCLEKGAKVRTYAFDLTDRDAVDSFAEKISAEVSGLDVIVLNAGISQREKAFDTDISVDRKLMETNFFGPVYLTKKLKSFIQGGKGVSLAVTTSISGLFGFPLRSSYSASKFALFGFYESLQLENPGIRVTFIVPGRINTPISLSAVKGDGLAYGKMDPGQEGGMSAEKCARIAVGAIARGRRRKLIGGKELLMFYIRRLCPPLFYKIAGKISAT